MQVNDLIAVADPEVNPVTDARRLARLAEGEVAVLGGEGDLVDLQTDRDRRPVARIDRLAAGVDDPWQNDYIYVYPGQHGEYDIYSLGADGQEGGEGVNADRGNWQTE